MHAAGWSAGGNVQHVDGLDGLACAGIAWATNREVGTRSTPSGLVAVGRRQTAPVGPRMNASRVLWRARGRPPPASPCSRPYHASFMKALAPLHSAHAGITCCLARQAAVLTDAASLGSGTQQVPAPPQLPLTHQSLQAMIDGHGMQVRSGRNSAKALAHAVVTKFFTKVVPLNSQAKLGPLLLAGNTDP